MDFARLDNKNNKTKKGDMTMSKELQEALRKISNIIDQWTDMRMDANDALELLVPLLETVTAYFQKEETPAVGEKKSLYEDLEKGLEDEKLEDLETYEPEEDLELEEDLFKKKSEDSEKKEEED